MTEPTQAPPAAIFDPRLREAQGVAQHDLVASHWGVYEVVRRGGRVERLEAFREDPAPSPIGLGMLEAYRKGPRVLRPAVRAGWLEHGPGRTERRGREPFVEIAWDEAERLVAGELRRVVRDHGNEAIFGGSYGWSSAGRFHHAQSQMRRFMNTLGGCVRSVDSYSLGAGRVVMPHVVAPMDTLLMSHTDWQTLAAHTRLFVCFGGVPFKNAQVMPGGPSLHLVPGGMRALAAGGCRFVNFSVVRGDLDVPDGACEWIPIRPNTDTAVMLGLATEIIRAGRADRAFLERYCVGFERWERYLSGELDGQAKDADWAGAIAGVAPERLRALALDMAKVENGRRTMLNCAWSLQRADHGEQPFWALVGLAALIGHIGLPGGGFGLGYGSANAMGTGHDLLGGPSFPLLRNAVSAFIPVARISDMLLNPGAPFDYNGRRLAYPHVRLVYWVGGNPFHHHQDLNRLLAAWRAPETVVVHEQVWNAHAKLADIVLPATSTLEREDIGYAHRDPWLVAMRKVDEPPGDARDDHAIFASICRHLGKEGIFTDGRSPAQWLAHMWEEWRDRVRQHGYEPPPYEEFRTQGAWRVPGEPRPVVMLQQFRADPSAAPLPTPSGRIEIFSERVAAFGYDDCPGHPKWLEPSEWLGSPLAAEFPLHLISDQPATKLHSQLDFSRLSRAGKVGGREPVLMHRGDAAARGIRDGDVVRVFNRRGECVAGAVLTDSIRPGVVKLSTGAWWDPEHPGEAGVLDKHGNPNVLTRDAGASRLSQGCAAQTCLVQVERFAGDPPPVTAFDLPELRERK